MANKQMISSYMIAVWSMSAPAKLSSVSKTHLHRSVTPAMSLYWKRKSAPRIPRRLQFPTHASIKTLAALNLEVSTSQKTRKERETEIIKIIYQAFQNLEGDKDAQRIFFAQDCWSLYRGKPAVDDGKLAHHCCRRVYGKDATRQVSDVAIAMNDAFKRHLSPTEFETKMIKAGGLRNLVRGKKRKSSMNEVRVSDEVRQEIRGFLSEGAPPLKMTFGLARTPTGVSLVKIKALVTEGIHVRDIRGKP